MAILQPNVWWLEQLSEQCDDGAVVLPRGDREFRVYVEEVDG